MVFILEGARESLGLVVRELSPKERGDEGERLVSGILRKFRGELLTNIHLPYCGDITKFIEIDNIFITPYSVFIVEAKYSGGKKNLVGRELRAQVRKQAEAVSYYLHEVGVKLESLVVLVKRERYYGSNKNKDVKVMGFADFICFISHMCEGGNKGRVYRGKKGKVVYENCSLVEEGVIRSMLLEQDSIYRSTRRKGGMVSD